MSHLRTYTGPVVSAVALSKSYSRGREVVQALDRVDLQIDAGEFVAIVGPSGAGKSTLLNLIGCMDAPSSGSLSLLGQPVEKMKESERTRFRRDQLGFVFQHFGLIQTLTVEENICLPALFAGKSSQAPVKELLQRVGLDHRRTHRPHELSGGEMQRVAIARALVNNPPLILADEPTGNLDTTTGETIIELFQQLNEEGLTIVVVTHNESLAQAASRRIHLVDGRVRASGKTELPPPAAITTLHTGMH
jgi:putative ABC transport system ATP-binding protein